MLTCHIVLLTIFGGVLPNLNLGQLTLKQKHVTKPLLIDQTKTNPSQNKDYASLLIKQFENLNKCSFKILDRNNMSLSIYSKNDGIGSTHFHLINGASYCASRNWKFDGITKLHNAHGIDERLYFNFFFGSWKNFVTLNETMRSGKVNQLSISVRDHKMLKDISPFLRNTHIKVMDAEFFSRIPEYSTEFIKQLQLSAVCGVKNAMKQRNYFTTCLDCSPYTNNSKQINVAVHIRHGDITEGHSKWIPESYYLHLFSIIHRIYPYAKIHIFTSVLSKNQISKIISPYKTLPYVYTHVDLENLKDLKQTTLDAFYSLAHMITADILVTGLSFFSLNPMIYNPNCVLHMPFPLFGHYRGVSTVVKLSNDLKNMNRLERYLNATLVKCVENKRFNPFI